MSIRAFALRAFVLAAPAALGAQASDAVPTTVASALPVGSVGSAADLRTREANAAMTREVYVLALRSGVRQGCRGGAADPVGAALASTRAVAQGLSDDERPSVMAAIDSAGAGYARATACASLGSATRLVVVDNFHGAAWHATKASLFGDEGTATDGGLTVVTRSVKLGSGLFHRFGAEADYTFTTLGGQLVAGRDRVPVDASDAPARWATLEQDLITKYPSLRVNRTQSGPAGSADVTFWRTVFSNPDTQALEVTLSASRDASGKVWISAEYPGLAGR